MREICLSPRAALDPKRARESFDLNRSPMKICSIISIDQRMKVR
jgi:hypothetical protein